MEKQRTFIFCVGILVCVIASIVTAKPSVKAGTEEEAIEYLKQLDLEYSKACNVQMVSRWNYITNVTKENEAESIQALNEYLQFQGDVQQYILDKFPNWKSFSDPSVKRQFQFLVIRGPGKMDPVLVEEMNDIMGNMESAYAEATVCAFKDPTNCTLRLEPEIEEKLRTAQNFDELNHYWTAWHDAMSDKVTTADYKRFIELQNIMAKANGYNNMGDLWAAPYDDGSADWTPKKFEDEMLAIWEELRPLYNKLHAYVRMKLRPVYADKIDKFGLLPANLMGNMWAQDWTVLNAKTRPFPNVTFVDTTAAMIKANYNATYMFQVADEFFQNLGLTEMTDTFWEKSMIERPDDREVVCHASAEDFCLGAGSEDFRIKMCTNVNDEDLVTVHHEMGHIEYFMQYSDHPFIFRDGANPGFHEAIGDALALAVTTPKHLVCVLGLDIEVDVDCSDSETGSRAVTPTDLNFLYYMALQKFSFFPFAISMDSWRWGVFDGSIPEAEYNTKWWEIRQKNQGIEPPSPRSDTSFDASAKYHIVANVEYIRYFISHILQFQFYEAMCIAAGEYNPDDPNTRPLYQCDFDGSEEAGKLFGDMMRLGFSESWPVALKALNGSEKMNTKSLLNYFEPLFDLIDEELAANGELPGFYVPEEATVMEYINGHYEQEASRYCNLASVADFNYQTNLTSAEAEAAVSETAIQLANFEQAEYKANISQIDYANFKDEGLKRQLKFLNAIGTSALNQTDLEEYNRVLSEMSKIYGTAKVCPFEKQECNVDSEGLALEPDLTRILAELKDYDEMSYLWGAWRDASGKKMRDLYLTYVDLSNKAAVANDLPDMGDFWLLRYESETFREDIAAVYADVKTRLYEPLYNFVRHRLAKVFPQMHKDKMIPAHVLGNMWSQTWENILPHVLPFPDAASFDITQQLVAHLANSTSDLHKRERMFDFANDFFKGLGLSDMSVAYHAPGMIMKPEDREVICHASAWDMCDGKDFRIKMCTDITHNDFITIHHELGHIQYYLNYKNLPYVHRTGANPGFHEAIGDVVALSVSTPKHLETIGFPVGDADTLESKTNYLMQMALEKIAFLPFGYLIDSYRWKIFNGEIPPGNLTYNWLKMSAEYQGVISPIPRSELDFDAGAKYHVPANTPYIRYFVSFILQFQVHKVLCEAAGQATPLSECDIHQNAAAGKIFESILKAGASKSWQDLLEEVTGTRKLDASAIIEYFEPLLRFLTEQADTENYHKGWDWTEFEDTFTDPTITPASSSPAPEEEDDDDNDVAAIVVGIVLGVVVLVIVIGYFFGKKCRK